MDMSPRCLAARGMFSGQGGLVYTEMAPKCSCRVGGAVQALGISALSSRFSTLCRVLAKRRLSAALQRDEPVVAGERTHGKRREAGVWFSVRRTSYR